MAFLDEGMVHDKERYKGCLIGAVIGDSLGAPFEFRNKWQDTYTLSRDDVLAEIDPKVTMTIVSFAKSTVVSSPQIVTTQEVSSPVASSPAAFVVPGGQLVQLWSETYSFNPQIVVLHVVSSLLASVS